MLVLSRKANERISLGGIGDILIVEVRGDRARLGISLPEGITVHRSEIQKTVQEEIRGQLSSFTQEEQDRIVDWIYSEIAFTAMEKETQRRAEAVRSTLDSVDDFVVDVNGEGWHVCNTESGPILLEEK